MVEGLCSVLTYWSNNSVEKMSSSFEALSVDAKNGQQIQMVVNEKIEQIKTQSEILQEANLAISAIAGQKLQRAEVRLLKLLKLKPVK